MIETAKSMVALLFHSLRALLAASLAAAMVFTLVYYFQAYLQALVAGSDAPRLYGLILFLAVAFILALPLALLATGLAAVLKHGLTLDMRIASMASAGTVSLWAYATFGDPTGGTLVAVTFAAIAGCEAHIWFRRDDRPALRDLFRRGYAAVARQCGGTVSSTPGKWAMRSRQSDSAGNRLSNWS